MDYKRLPQTKADEIDGTGAFHAIVAAWTLDREGEVIRPGAFADSLVRWRGSGKMIPVLADHGGKVGSVIGSVDPRLSTETDEGLDVTGTFDLSTELGRRTHELVKANSVAWSIGFVVPKGGRRKARDGVELTEIDLAEISVVPVPANSDTRTVSVKAARGGEALSLTQIEAQSKALGIETRALKIASFEC
jgi:uncharacterized protein